MSDMRVLAEETVAHLREQGVADLAFDEGAIAWIDGYIERQRVHNAARVTDEEFRQGLSNSLGAVVGECIMATYGGTWRATEHGWAVAFDEKNAAFPCTKVYKQLTNGSGDSVLAFFQAIAALSRRPNPLRIV
jgi:hypothetical protein